jgi:hypothetical protein
MVLRQLLLIKEKQGISMQKKYKPKAIILDMKLPELMAGLLNWLKEGQRITTHSCTRNVRYE